MDKATKLSRIEGLRAGALRVVKEMGSWTEVKMGDRDCALKGAEIGDVKILLRTPFQPLPPTRIHAISVRITRRQESALRPRYLVRAQEGPERRMER
jgi:hypothetical protein